jgi:hypothetical protein
MPTAATAAVTAVTFVALYAGHQIGDHPVQPIALATGKAAPTADLLAVGAHPWTGWAACARHVATYTLTQAVALALVALVAPLSVFGALAALAASACTHAVIDRGWIVRLMVQAKGCQDWRLAPYLLEQSLHTGALLIAAVLAARVITTTGTIIVVAVGALLVGAALLAERLRVAAVDSPVDSFRL